MDNTIMDEVGNKDLEDDIVNISFDEIEGLSSTSEQQSDEQRLDNQLLSFNVAIQRLPNNNK